MEQVLAHFVTNLASNANLDASNGEPNTNDEPLPIFIRLFRIRTKETVRLTAGHSHVMILGNKKKILPTSFAV